MTVCIVLSVSVSSIMQHTVDLLPSSVNVQLLVRGPNPAEVLAFIEILYGMYLSKIS